MFGGKQRNKIIKVVAFLFIFFVVFVKPNNLIAAPSQGDIKTVSVFAQQQVSIWGQTDIMNICFSDGTTEKSENCPANYPYNSKQEAQNAINNTQTRLNTAISSLPSNLDSLYKDTLSIARAEKLIKDTEEIIKNCYPITSTNPLTFSEAADNCPEENRTRSYLLSQIKGVRQIQNQQKQNFENEHGKGTFALMTAGVGKAFDDVYNRAKGIIHKLSPLELIKEGIRMVLSLGANVIIHFFGLILRFAGMLLNGAIVVSIFKMSDFLNTPAIEMSWSIFRDIINILFIFGLLYISIKTIVWGYNSAQTKSFLVGIISAAILINFSYFFTTVLIDTSNYLTVEIYGQIGECAQGPVGHVLSFADGGIAHCFLDALQLTTFLEPNVEGGFAAVITGGKNSADQDFGSVIDILIAAFMSVIFILIVSFVFVALALMLLIRFIILIFLLITSPVYFLQYVLPIFKGISEKWSKSLINNLLFPPIVFIFLAITLAIIQQINMVSGGPFEIIIRYILIIGFTITSIVIAKKLGASGADFATQKGSAFAFGGAAILGRNTVGRFSTNVADRMKGTGAGSAITRDALKSIGNKSFDARNTKAFKGVGSATGIGLGSGKNTGFIETRDKRIKKQEERAKESEKQTKDERNEIESLTQKIANDEKNQEALKKRKDLNKSVENNKKLLRDLNQQASALDQQSAEFKAIKKKAGEVAKQIKSEEEGIDGIDEAIQTRSAQDIERIEAIKKAGKDRQEEVVKRYEKSYWWPTDKEAAISLRSRMRGNDDKQTGELEQIIKNTKRDSERRKQTIQAPPDVNIESQTNEGGQSSLVDRYGNPQGRGDAGQYPEPRSTKKY